MNQGMLSGGNYPPEAHFVVGVLIEELRHAQTWDSIVKVADALRNVRQQAQAMRAEAQRFAQPSGPNPYQGSSITPPPNPTSWEPVHPNEVDPNYDQQLPWSEG